MGKKSQKNIPCYKQIIDWVLEQITAKELLPGDKLPTEKELALRFSTSRGTVRTALIMLRKNSVIDSVQGSGYYVSKVQDVAVEKTPSIEMIEAIKAMIADLNSKGFSNEEIADSFSSCIDGTRFSVQKQIVVSVVDCNPDIFPSFRRQLQMLQNARLEYFLLHSASTMEDTRELDKADLIVTTPNHFKQLLDLRPDLAEKTFRYNISTSQKTLRSLLCIPSRAKIGLSCLSKRFYELVSGVLENVQGTDIDLRVCYNGNEFGAFSQTIDWLILPFGCTIFSSQKLRKELESFQERGGRVIVFEYQVEQGSIAFLEELIPHLMEEDS